MSLVSELQRRNVLRVVIAYLAVAWLLLQVAETLLPVYGFGDGAIRIVVTVLGIGLIPAVIFAWVFELTPEGLKKETEVDRGHSITRATGKKLDLAIIGVLVLAIMYFAFDKFVLSDFRVESARQQARTAALVESYGDKSIAVLPFLDMSAAGDQEYMSDGIAEELLNLLAKVQQLRVISRSSAFSFKGKSIDVPSIAKQLNVAYILEGSVRKSDQTIRITTQLIEARSDTHLWSETYERELDDIFAIQDEIAKAVVGELKVALLGEVPKARETDPEAYELFLQARSLHEQPAGDSFVRAFEFYKAALEIDEAYVPAWVWLAALYDDTVRSSGLPYDEVGRLAREAIQRALEIDPNDAMALGMSGIIIEAWDNDMVTAGARMQRALELDPNNPILLRWAGLLLNAIGRYEEAVRVNEYLLSRDPVGRITRINLASSYLNTGRFEGAIDLCKIQVAVNSEDVPCRYRLILAYLYSGDGQSALQNLEQLGSPSARSRLAPMVFHALGRQEDFESALAELHNQYRNGIKYLANQIALVYAFSGDVDAAFEWMERAIDDEVAKYSPNEAEFASLHDDPRWDVLMKKAGTSQETLDAIVLEVNLPE